MSVSVIFYHIDLKVESLLVSFIYLFGINKQYLSEYRLLIFVFIHNHCFSFEKMYLTQIVFAQADYFNH